MDPASAIGVASAVLTFITFSQNMVSKSKEIYKSADGQAASKKDLSSKALRLNELYQDLNASKRNGISRLSSNESAIQEVAFKCAKTAQELQTALEDLVAQPKKSWSSVRKALKSVLKESKIRQIDAALTNFNAELHLHLTAALRNDNSQLMLELNHVRALQQKVHVQASANLADHRKDLLASLERSQGRSLEALGRLEDSNNMLVRLAKQKQLVHKQCDVLNSLSFPSILSRRQAIKQEHAATLDWILDDYHAGQEMTFKTWLRNCFGPYWITGKPGCGKSTLMKFIQSHEGVRSILHDWADGSRLVIGSHYFWNAGVPLQKSLEGLLRTLLFDVLRQCPEAFPGLPRNRWSDWDVVKVLGQPGWDIEELTRSLQHVIEEVLPSTKFCFYVDGMDEFHGEPRDIVAAVRALSVLPNVKICLSSRSWNVFEAEFGRNSFQLQVHEHTRGDIQKFVYDVLERDSHFQQLRTHNEEYQTIIVDIVQKAQGVFLWVFLVVRNLSSGLPNADTFHDLRRRIDEFPTDLDKYFETMLNNIPNFYQTQSAQILLMALEAEASIPLLVFHQLIDRQSSILAVKHETWSETDLECRSIDLRKRVKIRGQDLIDVVDDPDYGLESGEISRYTTQLIHRTVFDYLRQGSVLDLLRLRAGSQFSAAEALSEGYFAYLHISPTGYLERSIERLPSTYCNIDIVILYASRAMNNSDWPAEAILDLLESQIEHIRKSIDECRLTRSLQNPVLFSAIQFGLCRYVRRRLEKCPELVDDINDQPALLIATGRYKHDLFLGHVPFGVGSLNPAMFALLLGSHANPNQVVCLKDPVKGEIEESVWTLLYHELESNDRFVSSSEDDRFQEAFSIIELMVRHGARRHGDPRFVMPFPVHSRSWLYSKPEWRSQIEALCAEYEAPVTPSSTSATSQMPSLPRAHGATVLMRSKDDLTTKPLQPEAVPNCEADVNIK